MESHQAAVEALRRTLMERATGPLLYVVGGVDTGKTTLGRELAGFLARRWPTVRVEADPGQPSLGLPTCVAAGWAREDAALAQRFVGDVTPAGHMLQALTGVARLVRLARAWGAEAIVVDSSGYVGSEPAWAFQHQTIDLLEPDRILALGTDEAMEPVVAPFRLRRRLAIHRLPPSPRVRPRTREERRRYREERLDAHFRHGKAVTLDPGVVPLHGRVPSHPADARGRVAALLDSDGFVLALGVVDRLEPGSEVSLTTPVPDPGQVAGVELGSLTWPPEGPAGRLQGEAPPS